VDLPISIATTNPVSTNFMLWNNFSQMMILSMKQKFINISKKN